jgi:hypothetical protein
MRERELFSEESGMTWGHNEYRVIGIRLIIEALSIG